MKWLPLMLLFLGIAGCSTGIAEQQVKQDFLRIVHDQHQHLGVRNLQKVTFGDGWDDGVEARVYFDAMCKPSTSPSSTKSACSEGKTQMHLSYQRNADGKWAVLSSKIVPDPSR